MGSVKDFMIAVDSFRKDVIIFLGGYSDMVTFAAEELIGVADFQEFLNCHYSDIVYLVDSSFKIIESWGISDVAVTFEDTRKFIF